MIILGAPHCIAKTVSIAVGRVFSQSYAEALGLKWLLENLQALLRKGQVSQRNIQHTKCHQPYSPQAWLWRSLDLESVWGLGMSTSSRFSPLSVIFIFIAYLKSLYYFLRSQVSFYVQIPLHIKHTYMRTASGYSSIWSFSVQRVIQPWFKNISHYSAFPRETDLASIIPCQVYEHVYLLRRQKCFFLLLLLYPYLAKRTWRNTHAWRVRLSMFPVLSMAISMPQEYQRANYSTEPVFESLFGPCFLLWFVRNSYM